MNIKGLAWNEKYRPTTIRDVVSPYIERILKYMEHPDSMPNFLFYSKKGGTGKSSMAKAIVKDLSVDCLELNASKDRSIDIVRNKITDFARCKSSNGLRRCVFMDEFERMTKDASEAIKNLIETYSANCFFIGTTNNLEKISDPLQSRFILMEFVQPRKEDILKRLKYICNNEALDNTEEGLNKVIDIHYPSIRRMINNLQDLKMQGNSVTLETVKKSDDVYSNLWKLVSEKKYSEVKRKSLDF